MRTRAATYRDEWTKITGLILPGEAGQPDSLALNYVVRNQFKVVAYSKRDAKHWWQFWKPRKVYVDLKNENPHTTNTMEAILVEKR